MESNHLKQYPCGEWLTAKQRVELHTLLQKLSVVMSNVPGVTSMTEHCIKTGNARPVKLPPYRILHAYREAIQREIKKKNGSLSPLS